jgi:ATP-dependent Lon protease
MIMEQSGIPLAPNSGNIPAQNMMNCLNVQSQPPFLYAYAVPNETASSVTNLASSNNTETQQITAELSSYAQPHLLSHAMPSQPQAGNPYAYMQPMPAFPQIQQHIQSQVYHQIQQQIQRHVQEQVLQHMQNKLIQDEIKSQVEQQLKQHNQEPSLPTTSSDLSNFVSSDATK